MGGGGATVAAGSGAFLWGTDVPDGVFARLWGQYRPSNYPSDNSFAPSDLVAKGLIGKINSIGGPYTYYGQEILAANIDLPTVRHALRKWYENNPYAAGVMRASLRGPNDFTLLQPLTAIEGLFGDHTDADNANVQSYPLLNEMKAAFIENPPADDDHLELWVRHFKNSIKNALGADGSEWASIEDYSSDVADEINDSIADAIVKALSGVLADPATAIGGAVTARTAGNVPQLFAQVQNNAEAVRGDLSTILESQTNPLSGSPMPAINAHNLADTYAQTETTTVGHIGALLVTQAGTASSTLGGAAGSLAAGAVDAFLGTAAARLTSEIAAALPQAQSAALTLANDANLEAEVQTFATRAETELYRSMSVLNGGLVDINAVAGSPMLMANSMLLSRHNDNVTDYRSKLRIDTINSARQLFMQNFSTGLQAALNAFSFAVQNYIALHKELLSDFEKFYLTLYEGVTRNVWANAEYQKGNYGMAQQASAGLTSGSQDMHFNAFQTALGTRASATIKEMLDRRNMDAQLRVDMLRFGQDVQVKYQDFYTRLTALAMEQNKMGAIAWREKVLDDLAYAERSAMGSFEPIERAARIAASSLGASGYSRQMEHPSALSQIASTVAVAAKIAAMATPAGPAMAAAGPV